MDSVWQLQNNPFFWEGVVFLTFGYLCAVALSAVWGFPKRLLETM